MGKLIVQKKEQRFLSKLLETFLRNEWRLKIMVKEKYYVCKRRKIGDVYEVECKEPRDNKSKKTFCVITTEGKTGGASLLGTGGQYGQQSTKVVCIPEKDFSKEVAKSLEIDEKNIKIIDGEIKQNKENKKKHT